MDQQSGEKCPEAVWTSVAQPFPGDVEPGFIAPAGWRGPSRAVERGLSSLVFAAVLFAVACHAGWNAAIKIGSDTLSTTALIAIGAGIVVSRCCHSSVRRSQRRDRGLQRRS